ncbi:hypothetical protein [Nocardioides sp. 616]|uniref:hypothetical protein n=1 Tax=Nocardioides sp. 616 TaxID=2268090 RepID=UPI000CE523EE|nr:hypothetical protein [Nocardioides sp. 616]
METLVSDLDRTHQALALRLDRAEAARPHPESMRPRDQYPATDTFLLSASRHLGAVNEVLVPAARHRLPEGRHRASEFVAQCRALEVALNQVKAKLYGSAYAVRRPWSDIWGEVHRAFDAVWESERELAVDLVANQRDGDPDWSQRLHVAELHAPTRPHPYLPHQGLPGKVTHAVALRVDRFWDTAEDRMVPEPLHHHERSLDGPLTQYLLADPHLPDDDDSPPAT